MNLFTSYTEKLYSLKIKLHVNCATMCKKSYMPIPAGDRRFDPEGNIEQSICAMQHEYVGIIEKAFDPSYGFGPKYCSCFPSDESCLCVNSLELHWQLFNLRPVGTSQLPFPFSFMFLFLRYPRDIVLYITLNMIWLLLRQCTAVKTGR